MRSISKGVQKYTVCHRESSRIGRSGQLGCYRTAPSFHRSVVAIGIRRFVRSLFFNLLSIFPLIYLHLFSSLCTASSLWIFFVSYVCRLSRGTGVAAGARRQRKASSKLPTQSDELQEVKHQLVYRRFLTGRPLLF
jgi:hypothetical protein